MKGLRVTKIINKIKFEGVWGELESKRGFQGQSTKGYFRLALVFLWSKALRKDLIAIFRDFLASVNKDHFVGFRHFPNISSFEKILSPKSFGNS